MSIQHNSACKNLFLGACCRWDGTLCLCEVDQKFIFGEVVGCDDAYLEFLVRHFKLFRLHAKLHDAAGAVHVGSGKRSGYCYMIGRVQKSSVLGQVTGLLFCFRFSSLIISAAVCLAWH